MSNIKKENQANTKSIFKHLFNQMKKLEEKEIDVDEAKAQANLAKQANNILKYELDRARTMAEYPNRLRKIED